MGQGDKMGAAGQDDAGEIDRIMKEIEELEKNMETAAEPAGNVVSLRPETVPSAAMDAADSLVESDAVPPTDEPLIKSEQTPAGEGSLSLKVGGCAEVNLEFSQAGVAVTLHCDAEGLSITTDQGAEFRIPFTKKVA